MGKYQVEIIEKLSRVIEVEADCYEEAEQIAEDKYSSGDIILDYNDLEDVSYQQYPLPVIDKNFNFTIKYDKDENVFKVLKDNMVLKLYDFCKNTDDCLSNLKNFMNEDLINRNGKELEDER